MFYAEPPQCDEVGGMFNNTVVLKVSIEIIDNAE